MLFLPEAFHESLLASLSIQEAANKVYDWLTAAVPGVRGMPQFRHALCDHPLEIFNARKLWNYPRTDRPSSDNKS